MSQILQHILQIKEMNDLREYAQAQYNTIMQLNKKVQRLEEERDHLKSLLEQTVPVIKPDQQIIEADTDQELICKLELQKLREISSIRELTYEECKKVEIYSKILGQKIDKKNEREVEKIDTKDLLKLVEKIDDNGK